MKKITLILLLILSGSFLLTASADAGTLMVGAKAWYAWWDSAIGEFFVNQTNKQFEQWLVNEEGASSADINSDVKLGQGILGGPLVGYQTDDRQWSFSCALMYFGAFKQEADTIAMVGTEPTPAKYEIELNRKEIDIAIIRILTPNLKLFVGYKHQILEQDINLTVYGTVNEKYKCYEIDAIIKAPTAGLGFSLPIAEKMFLGGQFGLLYVMPTIKYKGYINAELYPATKSVEDEEYDFDNTIGINGEISLAYFASPEIVLQLAYRYQKVKFKKNFGADSGGESFAESDVFQGVVFSAIYMTSMN